MYTLSYPFRPWKGPRSMVDGPSIWAYIRDTAAEHGIDRHIRFRQRVVRASWSSDDARWTLQVRAGDEADPVEYTADFLYLCSGYFSYDQGFMPEFPGTDHFAGTLVHPQFWPEDLDYAGKQVVVIGSGATAVTMVPRWPSGPATSRCSNVRRATSSRSPVRTRWPTPSNAGFPTGGRAARPLAQRGVRRGDLPALPARAAVRPHDPHQGGAAPAPARLPGRPALHAGLRPVGPADVPRARRRPVRGHRRGPASVVTDRIATFTEHGIGLESGAELPADIVVAATGLEMLAWGGIEVDVDGVTKEPGKAYFYRGFMMSDIPNLAMCIGYTNASWTLRADLVSRTVCRLLNHMDRLGYDTASRRSTARWRTAPRSTSPPPTSRGPPAASRRRAPPRPGTYGTTT